MNIDLNQVFHLHNSVDRPITVVYKSCIFKISLKSMLSWKLMKQTMLQSKDFFDGKDPDEVYNMSTDVFIVDTPWLIEKNWRRSQERIPTKIALYLAWFGSGIQCFCLWIYRLPCQYSFSGTTTMQTWICWKPKFMKLFFTKSKGVYERRMKNNVLFQDFTY